MISSKSMLVVSLCEILSASEQIPYAVLSACLMNARKRAEVEEHHKIIETASTAKNATNEEVTQEIKAFDDGFMPQFRTIKRDLVGLLKKEMLPIWTMKDGNKVESKMNIMEVFVTLENFGIITE